jgi:hypothetical protein
MDFQNTLTQMLTAAKAAAGIHWKDVREYMKRELARAEEEAKSIALEVANEVKTPEQAKIELESIEVGLRDVKLALTVAAKAAAQDAINAALDVLRSAVNSAAKVAIF